MAQKYIGIENEFTSFFGNSKIDYTKYFWLFCKRPDYLKSCWSVRAADGLGFYVDGCELEVVTPPVVINKGFATRLTDSLIIGRNRIAKSWPTFKHTGYSMHWNVTKNEPVIAWPDFLAGIAIPFSLFCLTPLSVGMNYCEKESRIQLAGDFLADERQINAAALILGAYSYAIEESGSAPIQLAQHMNKSLQPVQDGRYSMIEANISCKYKPATMQAQQYLEVFYQWIKPYVLALGTEKEAENLEWFISGKNKLEFDKFRYYAYLNDENGKKDGMYLPVLTGDKDYSPMLKYDNRKRELPLECRLLGEIVKHKKCISRMGWNSLRFVSKNGIYVEKCSIAGIYKFANKLNPDLPKFKEAVRLKVSSNAISPMDVDEILQREKLVYRQEDDSFIDDRGFGVHYHIGKEVRRKGLWGFAGTTLACLAAASIITFSSCSIYDWYAVATKADSMAKSYSHEKTENLENIGNSEKQGILKKTGNKDKNGNLGKDNTLEKTDNLERQKTE